MDSPERVLNAISKLLSPFPAGAAQGTADEVIRRYLEAVEEFIADDIEAGVDFIMKGKLAGYNGNFAPTPPQLATAARTMRDKRLDHEALMRRYTPRIAPPDVERTPEAQQRVRQVMAQAVKTIGAADGAPTEEAAAAEAKERWEKVNSRFQPPMDDESVADRLNLNRSRTGVMIGSPDGEAAA